MTFGLLSKRPSVGREASGFGGQPMLSVMDESKVYAQEGEDIVIEKKMVPMANKTEEKGGDADGSHGNVGMVVNGLLGPCRRNNIIGG